MAAPFKLAALVVVALAATGLAIACLPDLVVLPPPPPKCGDGLVDLDQGEMCDPGDAGPASAGCTANCTMDCDGGFVDPKSGHCYYWGTSATSKDFAEHFCGAPSSKSHVVTFASVDELTLVAAQSQGPKMRGAPDAAAGFTAWSALQLALPLNSPGTPRYNNDGETGWSRDCPGCWARIDDIDAGVFPPRNDGGATGECATWSKFTKLPWFTSVCDLGNLVRPVLCEREPAGDFSRPCADGTCINVVYTFKQKSYVLVQTPATADLAENSCQRLGGRLVVFGSHEEREEVLSAAERRLVGGEAWIGLSRESGFASWRWDDQSDISKYPLPWADLEPRATDAARAWIAIDKTRYDTRLAHADDDALALRPYICER